MGLSPLLLSSALDCRNAQFSPPAATVSLHSSFNSQAAVANNPCVQAVDGWDCKRMGMHAAGGRHVWATPPADKADARWPRNGLQRNSMPKACDAQLLDSSGILQT